MTVKPIRISVRFLLFSLILAYSLIPFLSRFISTYLSTYAYMLVLVWTIFVIVFSRGMEIINRYAMLLMPFLFYNLLTLTTRNNSIILWGYQMLLFLLPMIVGYYLINERSQYIPGLCAVLCLAVVITIVTTIIGLINFPLAARVLATISSTEDADFIKYGWNNIGGYEFVYTLALLYPLLILAYKQKRLPLVWAVVGAVGIGTVIVMSEYAAALLLFLLSTVLFFLSPRLSARGMVVFSTAGILFVLFFSNVFSDLLMDLADNLESVTLKERLVALAGGTEGLNATDNQRIMLYRSSWNSFLKSPFFGSMIEGRFVGGGHSQVLDTLSCYGIFGAAAMTFMYRCVYNRFLKPFRQETGFGYVVWFFVQALFLSCINTSFFLPVLTLYGPIILYCIYHKAEAKKLSPTAA